MNFGFPGSGSASSTGWLSFGNHQRDDGAPDATSPAAPTTVPESPNHFATDEISFAASFHAETSPLFNPSVVPHSDSTIATPLFAKSPNPVNSWESQFGIQNPQSSPLAHGHAAYSPDLSTQVDDHGVELTGSRYMIEDNAEDQDAHDQVATGSHSPTRQGVMEAVKTLSEHEEQLLGEQESAASQPDAAPEASTESAHAQHEVDQFIAEENEPPALNGVIQTNESTQEEPETANTATPDEIEQPSSSETEIPHTLPQATPSSRRSRRTAAEMLSAAAESITKDLSAQRKRFSIVPPSPAVNPTPTSAKRPRKSIPAGVDIQTPRKRGRPRKSDATAATPGNVPKSTGKRGRPRKSDVLASTPGNVTRQPTTTSTVKSISKPTQLSSTTTTPKVGRPRKALNTPSAPATDTPRRRGRPPKSAAQPSPAKPITTQSPAVGPTSSTTTSRAVKARVVPSPAKRGRPARKAAPSAPIPEVKQAVVPKPTATRGRPPAPKPVAKSTIAETHVKTPRRRGRPPKATPAPAEANNDQVAGATPTLAAKKRGQVAATGNSEPGDVPPPEVAQPSATKKRGRPPRAKAPVETDPEPPAKRQRASHQTEKNVTAAEISGATVNGRKAVKETSDDQANPDGKAEVSQVRRTRRDATKVSVDKLTEEPTSARPRGRQPKSGKGEIETSKGKAAPETKAVNRKSGRGTAPSRVEKIATTAAAPRRSTRSRG